jgi:nucleoside-diphosphate-sugar epimerase
MEKPFLLYFLLKNISQSMAKVLIVGCGDLGGEVARRLFLAGYEVVGVRASDKPLPPNIKKIQADITQPKSLTALQNINPDILIYCVAASAQTDESYQANYVEGLKNALATQTNNHALQHVFFVSSTRVYGQTHHSLNPDTILDEDTPVVPSDFGGERLLEAENVLKQLPCKSTSMRLSGIYGRGRLYLVNMAKDPTRWSQENNWSNRIHRDDAARFIVFLCDKVTKKQKIEDCYIVTDDMPTLQYDVLTWLAKRQGVETTHINIAATHGGKRLSNKRMRGTGFQLQYPNYQAGYSQVLEEQ